MLELQFFSGVGAPDSHDVREIADHGQTQLMIWNAPIYCTQVATDILVVLRAPPWLTCSVSWNTLVQVAAPQCWMDEREKHEELCV